MPRPLELPLPRLQRWMQAVIEQPGTVEEAVDVARPRAPSSTRPTSTRVILPSKTLTPVERVGVYQGMYLLRMVEALEGDYPAVAHLLGDEEFADLVTRYVAAHPSRSYTFNRLGDRFPEFVRASQGIRRKAFVADLARLELASPRSSTRRESPALAGRRDRAHPAGGLGRGGAPSDRRPFASARSRIPSTRTSSRSRTTTTIIPPTGARPTWSPSGAKNYEVWRLDLTKPAYDFLGRSRRAGRSARPSRRRRGGSRAPRATSSSAGCATGSPRECSRASSCRPSLSAAIFTADA